MLPPIPFSARSRYFGLGQSSPIRKCLGITMTALDGEYPRYDTAASHKYKNTISPQKLLAFSIRAVKDNFGS